MIVFTPIDLPRIEPDNWEIFWDVWNKHKGSLVKVRMNHAHSTAPIGNSVIWTGLDIYKKFNNQLPWDAPFVDIRQFLPNMYNTIHSLAPNIHRARLVQSQVPIMSHSDDDRDIWNIRAFIHGHDPYKQWYFTRPHNSNGERTYIDMPSDTNWFMYNDKYSWHGTDFDADNKKILLQLYFVGNPSVDYLTRSIEKYKQYTVEF